MTSDGIPDAASRTWRRTTSLLVLAAVAAVLATHVAERWEPYTFLHGDGAFYATINRALLQGTLDAREVQPTSWYEGSLGWNRNMDQGWSNVALGADGTWYPKHPFLMPVLATPLFWLGGYGGLLAFDVLMTLLTLWLAWRIACRWVRPEVAGMVTVACAALPLFAQAAYSYSNDIFYAALVLGGIERFLGHRTGVLPLGYRRFSAPRPAGVAATCLLARLGPRHRRFAPGRSARTSLGDPRSPHPSGALAGRPGWSGALLGLAIFAKPTNVLFGLPLGAWLLWERRWRDAAWMAGAAAIPVGAFLVSNAVMFGSPFTTAYDRILVLADGRQVVESVRERFTVPLVDGMIGLVTEPGGLWEMAHLLLVGLVGVPWLWRRAGGGVVALGALWLLAYGLFYGPYDYRYARFFLPWAGLLIVPLSAGVDGVLEALARGLEALRRPAVRRSALLGAVALALAVLGLRLAAAADDTWRGVDAVEEARVTRTAGARTTPCDYFNPNHQKFECARVEREAWKHWGRAVGEECTIGDEPRDWLWLHAPPAASKRMTFEDVPPGPVTLRYALSDASRTRGARFRVFEGDRELAALETGGAGEIRSRTVSAEARRGGSLTVEVPEQPHSWRQLCVDLVVEAPGG